MSGENESPNRILPQPWSTRDPRYSPTATPWAFKPRTPQEYAVDNMSGDPGARNQLIFNPLVGTPGNYDLRQADGSIVPFDEHAADSSEAMSRMFGLAGIGMAALPVGAAMMGAGAGGAEGGAAGLDLSEWGAGEAAQSAAGHGSGLLPSATNAATSFAPGGTPPGSSSAISRLLSGNATTSDYLDVIGKGGSTILGLVGSDRQGDAYQDVANQYLALGAGDRARLEASYQPGFNLWKQPGYGELLNSVTDTQLNRLSTKGNPFGNPSGLQEMNKNIMNNVGLPALSNYRSQLLQGGGTGLNTSAAANLTAAGTARQPYDVLSAGLASMTTPQNSESELLDLIRKAGTGGIRLGNGFTS